MDQAVKHALNAAAEIGNCRVYDTCNAAHILNQQRSGTRQQLGVQFCPSYRPRAMTRPRRSRAANGVLR